jgi:hypothetical protein
MTTRLTVRPAACVLTLTLLGALIAASVWTDSVSQQIAEAPAGVGVDISMLATSVDASKLPVLSVRDPI